MNRHLNELKNRSTVLQNLVEKIGPVISGYPEGRIRVENKGNQIYYYLVNKGSDINGKHIGKNGSKTIHDLIQKNYLEKVLKTAVREREYIENTLRKYPQKLPEDIYSSFSAERRSIIDPIMLPDDEYISLWMNKQYVTKGINAGTVSYKTNHGEMVRSKSELIIADRLFAGNIPYRYECPLKLANGYVIHPDFTILRRSDRKELYLEHCGKMDDPDYAKKAVKRINDYQKSGIIPGDRLFLTMETSEDPFDPAMLDRMIQKLFT